LEPIQYHDDGTATVILYEGEVVLRRPRLGEFIKLREDLERRQEIAVPIATRLNERAEFVRSLSGEDRVSEETMATITDLRALTQEARDLGESTRLEWLLAVVQTLGPPETIITTDDFLPDVLEGTWPSDLIDHWKARPTRPGAR
jgi:hypothetical protein